MFKQYKTLFIVAAVVVVAAIGVVIVINSHTTPKPAPMGAMDMSNGASQPSTSPNITIESYAFGPAVTKVKVGTKVTWTNKDAVAHTVTADSPSPDAPTSMDIGQNQSYSFTFKKAGTYTYHCTPHPYMKGTVEVVS